MSIYATSLMIEDARQEAERLATHGIDFGVIGRVGPVELDDLPLDELDAPIIYQGSHILPSDDDPRGGAVDTGWIPDHIERDGRDDGREGPKPWLRLGVTQASSGDADAGRATVVLTREQVKRLRDDLSSWLDYHPAPSDEGGE